MLKKVLVQIVKITVKVGSHNPVFLPDRVDFDILFFSYTAFFGNVKNGPKLLSFPGFNPVSRLANQVARGSCVRSWKQYKFNAVGSNQFTFANINLGHEKNFNKSLIYLEKNVFTVITKLKLEEPKILPQIRKMKSNHQNVQVHQ